MMKKLIILTLFLFVSQCRVLWAYEGEVHMVINQHAVDASQLGTILKDKLRMVDGIETKLFEKNVGDEKIESVMDWIAYGGDAEDYGFKGKDDYPSTRAFNHFHDPLEDWADAGFDKVGFNQMYDHYYGRYPVSAITWGLNPGEQEFPQNTIGDWSWGKAREYYFIYLTGKDFEGNEIAITDDERKEIFAYCFQALGQMMHLLQDASVPLHTRNDLHIFPIDNLPDWIPEWLATKISRRWTYETYTSKHLRDQGDHKLDFKPDQPGDRPDPHLLEVPFLIQDPDYTNLVPISGLFDRNAYNDPGPIPPSNILGLAEYSNANFLTLDTMWNYQHPDLDDDTNYLSIDWLHPETVVAENGKSYNRLYIKFKDGVGEDIEHLAAVDYFTKEYLSNIHMVVRGGFTLDRECWKDYAAKLIPRAVGYSAALLDYFFRGKIEVTDFHMEFNQNTRKFEGITLYAKNTTDNDEAMSDGTLSMVIRYKLLGQDEFQYVVKQHNAATSIPRNEPVELIFNFSDMPIPVNASEMDLYLVFKGTLGNEDGAVCVGYKELLEILFAEEWDNGLTGNHEWLHLTGGHDPNHGAATNSISNEVLFKDNIRYVGQDTECYNESYLSLVDTENPDGILITPDTFVNFRIPQMSVNYIPSGTHWQALMLGFNNGLTVQYSQDGQFIYYNPTTAIYTFNPAYIVVDNIYNLFQDYGIAIPEPLYLESVDFIQQLFLLGEPATAEHHQHMEMDFIRVVGQKQ